MRELIPLVSALVLGGCNAGVDTSASGNNAAASASAAAPASGRAFTVQRLDGFQTIWRQTPKVEGRGHFGHRLAFGPDGKLYISNGDRQKFDPAQDMSARSARSCG
jgi:glucose/arabinose dehydrogenase